MDKNCTKCGILKPVSEYYVSNLSSCKSCVRASVKANRGANKEYYREYDRKRGSRQTKEYLCEWRKKYPQKYKAQTMVGNAIRGKKLFKQPCETCGESDRVHAHHDDYSKPLNVRWLCAAHHKQWHAENGEGLNGS